MIGSSSFKIPLSRLTLHAACGWKNIGSDQGSCGPGVPLRKKSKPNCDESCRDAIGLMTGEQLFYFSGELSYASSYVSYLCAPCGGRP